MIKLGTRIIKIILFQPYLGSLYENQPVYNATIYCNLTDKIGDISNVTQLRSKQFLFSIQMLTVVFELLKTVTTWFKPFSGLRVVIKVVIK